ncbi:MAG TPA: hypothetical protein VE258_14645, partial [Ktedonobacterales bacterium]|nr:hypothetical protein [Ktedonobacterales bacterium]
VMGGGERPVLKRQELGIDLDPVAGVFGQAAARVFVVQPPVRIYRVVSGLLGMDVVGLDRCKSS